MIWQFDRKSIFLFETCFGNSPGSEYLRTTWKKVLLKKGFIFNVYSQIFFVRNIFVHSIFWLSAKFREFSFHIWHIGLWYADDLFYPFFLLAGSCAFHVCTLLSDHGPFHAGFTFSIHWIYSLKFNPWRSATDDISTLT